MGIIIWNDTYSVGVREIDSQHKQLVDMINSLDNDMNSDKAKEELNRVLNLLTDYTIKHFSTEEELMMKYNYTDFNHHKEEHTNLVNDIKKFRVDYLAEKGSLSMDIGKYLKDWLMNHIMDTDKKLGKFLNRLGIY